MATAPFSPFAPAMRGSSPFANDETGDGVSFRGPVTVRRRPTQVQGHALEILGHAIEYLVDSRVVSESGSRIDYNRDAVALLSRSSREIFESCAAVVPIGDRLKQWLYGPGRKAA